ncbi:MAG: site-specific integrase [Candidatus Bipolaricaulia bacterium]
MSAQKHIIDQYQDHLTRVGKSSNTVQAYTHDVSAFATWFEQTTGENLDPRPWTPATSRTSKAIWCARG